MSRSYQLWAYIGVILVFTLASCYTPLYILNKKPDKWHKKQVRIKGQVVSWLPLDNYGYIIMISNKAKTQYLGVYKTLPSIYPGQTLVVKGTFYKDKSLFNLGMHIVVDSSGYFFDFSNPTAGKFKEIYGDYPKGFKVKLKTRVQLPPNCPQVRIQNNF